MCGIVGLFLKDKALEPRLGALTNDMLTTMCERGPDSAGFAVYGTPVGGKSKITLQSPNPDEDFKGLEKSVAKAIGSDVSLRIASTHAVLTVPEDKAEEARTAIRASHPSVSIMATGTSIEIYKEIGYPTDVAKRFDLSKMQGTHAIGYTVWRPNSAVTTLGSHPFSTGFDQCLVHNGSLSNHNNLRRELIRNGMKFETQNDTEVAALYVTARMNNENEPHRSFLRKASTTWTASSHSSSAPRTASAFFATQLPVSRQLWPRRTSTWPSVQYRALVNLPDIDKAKVWEPEPSTVYFWER